MIKDEIVKWLINERFVQKTADVKHLSYKQLCKKYQECVEQCQAMNKHLENLVGETVQ
jgi:hypothetical protein